MNQKQLDKLPSVSLKPFSSRSAILVTSIAQWNEVMAFYDCDETFDDEEDKYKGLSFPIPGNTNPYVIGVFDGKAQTLVHEVTHLVLTICARIEFNPLNEQEPFCYFLDHIFGTLNDHL